MQRHAPACSDRDARPLRETGVSAHTPRRRFGQNFLVDRAYIARIVEAIDPHRADRVVEIGPGLGALTGPLLERLAVLHVVEIDRDIVARLSSEFSSDRLVIHAGDALDFDFGALGPELRVIGNLPYNISSPLLFRAGGYARSIRDCHFMLQREVVDRMAAAPGSKTYGRLSVMLQYRFRIEKLFNVPAGAFRPAPQVDSAFVRLMPHAALPAPALDEPLLGNLVAKAFSQRRKTVRNALSDYANAEQLSELGIDPRLRPENLALEDFVRVANFASSGAKP
jgi:16S rRNA (adenine1518-N6/adenine1519-N6)-dimethyltransferase